MQKNTIKKIYKNYLLVNENKFDEWSKEFFASFFSRENVFFFSSKIPSEGYLIARKISDEYEVLSLATNKKKRRNGIASELLSNLLIKAKKNKIKKIFLEVSKKNFPAIKMYKKFGFFMSGDRKNYYKTSNGFTDAYIMTKLFD